MDRTVEDQYILPTAKALVWHIEWQLASLRRERQQLAIRQAELNRVEHDLELELATRGKLAPD
jgi:hypothetical protein